MTKQSVIIEGFNKLGLMQGWLEIIFIEDWSKTGRKVRKCPMGRYVFIDFNSIILQITYVKLFCNILSSSGVKAENLTLNYKENSDVS